MHIIKVIFIADSAAIVLATIIALIISQTKHYDALVHFAQSSLTFFFGMMVGLETLAVCGFIAAGIKLTNAYRAAEYLHCVGYSAGVVLTGAFALFSGFLVYALVAETLDSRKTQLC